MQGNIVIVLMIINIFPTILSISALFVGISGSENDFLSLYILVFFTRFKPVENGVNIVFSL